MYTRENRNIFLNWTKEHQQPYFIRRHSNRCEAATAQEREPYRPLSCAVVNWRRSRSTRASCAKAMSSPPRSDVGGNRNFKGRNMYVCESRFNDDRSSLKPHNTEGIQAFLSRIIYAVTPVIIGYSRSMEIIPPQSLRLSRTALWQFPGERLVLLITPRHPKP